MMQEKETKSREENPFIIHSSFPRVPLTPPCYYLTLSTQYFRTY